MGTWNRHRRSVALLCIGLSPAMVSCRRPAAEDRINIGCVTRLRLPRYPPIAQSALVGLWTTVAVALSRDSSPQSITFETLDKRFRLATGSSRENVSCHGRARNERITV
jgi:hypothetical protein